MTNRAGMRLAPGTFYYRGRLHTTAATNGRHPANQPAKPQVTGTDPTRWAPEPAA
jgi:hypothetical protein